MARSLGRHPRIVKFEILSDGKDLHVVSEAIFKLSAARNITENSSGYLCMQRSD